MKEEIKRNFPAILGSLIGLTVADIIKENYFRLDHFITYVIIAVLVCLLISYLKVKFKDKTEK